MCIRDRFMVQGAAAAYADARYLIGVDLSFKQQGVHRCIQTVQRVLQSLFRLGKKALFL